MRPLTERFGRMPLRSLGPSIAAVPLAEAVRAGIGALIGIAVLATLASLIAPDPLRGIFLIAPFGATSVLLFAAPNSPLAQPWAAVVGNTVSALAALLVCRVIASPALAVPLSVGAAIVVMALCRATHPPGGAVAMTVALGADATAAPGLFFALVPVAAGTAVLVAVAVLYGRATGRRYPFRQFGEPGPVGTADAAAPERLGLNEGELAAILETYQQSLNLGVEDLARLIGAAEIQAASHRIAPQTAGDIMSRDLVTVLPDTPLPEIAALFARHGFTSLPVVEPDGRYRGVIFQLNLITRARAQFRPDGRLSQLDRDLRAADLMAEGVPVAAPDTPIAALLPHLAASDTDAVPILCDGTIGGIVTRTDLIAALSRETLRRDGS